MLGWVVLGNYATRRRDAWGSMDRPAISRAMRDAWAASAFETDGCLPVHSVISHQGLDPNRMRSGE